MPMIEAMHPAPESALPQYTPSGNIPPRAYAVLFLAGLPAAMLMGWLFAIARSHAHGFLSSAICTALCSLAAAVVTHELIRQSHARSTAFAGGASALVITLLLLTRWGFTLAPLDYDFVRLVGSHDWADQAAAALGWLMEAIGMYLLPVGVAQQVARTPYSATCQAWAKADFKVELLWAHGGDELSVKAALANQGVQGLLDLPVAQHMGLTQAATGWYTLKVSGKLVPEDSDARWLSVALVTHTRDDDGKIKTASTALAEAWPVSAAEYQALVSHAQSEPDGADDNQPNDASDATNNPTPLELQPAVSAMEAGDHTLALGLARAYCQHPTPAVQADAHRLCALSHSGLRQWAEAFDDFHRLFDLEPTALNALQLATTSVMASQVLRGEAWYSRATEINQQSQEMPSPKLCTAYLSALDQAGEHEAAMQQLDWLAQAYQAIKITDDHALWMRGMPFLGEFLRRSLPIVLACKSPQDARAWYEGLGAHLDIAGQSLINQHVTLMVTKAA
jgi:tetratricopeptide (TPR) repeat protein